MSICSKNLSIGVFEFLPRGNNGVYMIKRKSIEGILGRCVFVPVDGEETGLVNNSFAAGARKLLKEGKIDLLAKPNDIKMSDSHLDISQPCHSEKLFFGQHSKIPESINIDALAFLNNSGPIIYTTTIGFFIMLFLIVIFLLGRYRKINRFNCQKILRFLINFIIFEKQFLSKVAKLNLIFVFYLLFFNINLDLLRNSIKTDGILINTNDIIDTEEKLLQTDRYACWFKKESITDLILSSSNSSFLHRIMNEKRNSDGRICFIEEIIPNYKEFSMMNMFKTFFIVGKTILLAFFATASKFQKLDQIIFIHSISDYEVLKILNLSPRLSSKLKADILKEVNYLFEHGLFSKFYSDFHFYSENMLPSENRYSSIGQLKDSFMTTKNLDLDYFHNAICYFFTANILTISIFLIHLLFKKLSKLIKYHKMKIKFQF